MNTNLGPWQSYGQDGYLWNFYRADDQNIIGFQLINSEIFKKDINSALWKIDYSYSSCKKVKTYYNLFRNIYGEHFKYCELEEAKKNLDKIIDNFATLKVFL